MKKRISWDEKSLIVDGKRIWIHDGEIHYFRHPHQDWRKVLLRAKRAGLNCISTYVAWNFHEMREGAFDLSGDRDLFKYIDIAHELGLYVMVRPGPYICSEWSGGGIPGWLGTQRDIELRTLDPVFMAATERWFEQLIPGLVERQITRGGPVISFQNDNEYHCASAGPRRDYIYAVRDLLKQLGVDVPIMGCNAHTFSDKEVMLYYSQNPDEWALDGLIITYNCGLEPEPVRHLRKIQPNAPVFVTELWTGVMVFWGSLRPGWPMTPKLVAGVAEFLSLGAQTCYYMFDGGTNFGYWAGCNIATSYESDYPVREGGVVDERYRMLRLVNLFSTRFGGFLAASEEWEAHGIVAQEGTRLVVRRSEEGAVIFFTLPDERCSETLHLPDGTNLAIRFDDVPAAILPYQCEVFPGLRIDHSNLSLLMRDCDSRTVTLYGAAGTEGVLCVNGETFQVLIGRHQVERMQIANATIVVLDIEMATRCWPLTRGTVYGADYVGEERDDGRVEVMVSTRTPFVKFVGMDGSEREWNGKLPAKQLLPKLDEWERCIAPEIEPVTEQDGWSPIDEPVYQDDLGIPRGYVWYRTTFQSDRDEVRELLIPGAQSRVNAYVNGVYAGVLGEHVTHQQRMDYDTPVRRLDQSLSIPVRRGDNTLVLLVDDSGHTLFEPSSIGMCGPAFLGARPFEPQNIDIREDDGNGNASVSFVLPLAGGEAALLGFGKQEFDVYVDGSRVKAYTHKRDFWSAFRIDGAERDRHCSVQLRGESGNLDAMLSKMSVHIAPASDELSGWAWHHFSVPEFASASGASQKEEYESEDSAPVLLAPFQKDTRKSERLFRAKWYRTTFDRPAGEQPVFLKLNGMHKGQIWLNGRNAGRFCKNAATQTQYYLPRAWMQDTNELVLFDEAGYAPRNVTLGGKNADPYCVEYPTLFDVVI